ncbi:MAG: glycosyltransferase family 2 protein [Peptococcaceae bacterium]|nr:glycosyltransferase family 2 protein [Peptococcaceae bacterium]
MERKTGEEKLISVVIPALNEAEAIGSVVKAIPKRRLAELGYQTQILVVDNGSTDGTGELAKKAGADVVREERRGYGRAYKTGFAKAKGEIIVTADADLTYPVEIIPHLVRMLEEQDLDFITTNRFAKMDRKAMSLRNKIGNTILNLTTRLLFFADIKDSQSGMWCFKKEVVQQTRLISDHMPFSQELKIKTIKSRKYKWKEVPIEYRTRVGEVKLNGWRDGFLNFLHLFKLRLGVE